MKCKSMLLLLASVITILPILTACDTGEPATFSIHVTPGHMEDTVVGQNCVFLVTVADESMGSGAGEVVNISATSLEAVVAVGPKAIAPGNVTEVVVIPDETSINKMLTVTINSERDGLEQTETVTLFVREEPPAIEDIALYATELRDKFIPLLAENNPEFEITSETMWAGTIVKPHTVVAMHYLFFSEDWEIGVQWHVMDPPNDWARIYLRQRTTGTQPSYAFEISSLDAQDEPQAIDPKEPMYGMSEVWR